MKIPRDWKKKIEKWGSRDLAIAIFSIFLFIGALTLFWIALVPLPDLESFETRRVSESTKILDRTGEVILFDVHKDIKRRLVPLPDISRHIKNATIAIEDSEFYEHGGVKPTAILRAFIVNLFSLDLTGQGGSTITQQVVKNTLLTGDKKYTRKLKEAVLAIKLEQAMDKNSILELYLNEAPYGGNLYGVEEAALSFFGKHASDITLPEAAYLAALPRAPTYYSPYGNNKERLEERKKLVLLRMEELGFITNDERREAENTKVLFNPPKEQGIKAPHFVLFVRDYLERTYGADLVESGGLRVITSLDWEMQKKGQEVITSFSQEIVDKFNAYNTALVAIDPATGQILSMIGSKDWSGESFPAGCSSGINCKFDPQVNVATRVPGRQPGSAFKPFVYATALKKGFTPETIIFDVQTQFSTNCDAYGAPLFSEIDPETCYVPQNFDFKFRGPVTFRDALAQSLNSPAVKVLYLAGLNDSIKTARDFGITTFTDPARYGLTLVLGGGEVSLLELTSAYSGFATGGVRNPYAFILRVEDKNGNVLEEFSPRPDRVIEENTAAEINDILSDNEARTPLFGAQSPLFIPGREVAVKTGTTDDFRDAWVVGYTPNLAVGMWAGNNDNSPMERNVAGFIIAPIWNAFMREVLPLYPAVSFTDPVKDPEYNSLKPVLRGIWRGGKSYFIDTISGKQATEYTPEETKKEIVLTEVHDILYWVNKNDPRGNAPEKPQNDPQFHLWEPPVRDWVKSQGIIDETEFVPPVGFDDVHTLESKPKITPVTPTEGGMISPGTPTTISVRVDGKYPISQVDFFFNEEFLGTQKGAPYSMTFTPSASVIRESNLITIRAYDSVRNKGEKTIEVRAFLP